MSANDALLLRFGENVHDAFVTICPVPFREAVHETDVEVIGAEFAAESIEIGTSGCGVACPSFCENGDFVARNMLEGFGDVRMAAITVGGIEEAEALLVTIEEETGEAIDAESGLVGAMAGADRAGAHGEAAGLDASAAESDGISGGEF